MEDSKNVYELFYREYLIYIMYLDAYKINSYKQKECVASDSDTDFLNQLICIKDSDDLLAEVSADPVFLVRLIEESYQFYEMNGLGKVYVVKSLDEEENQFLEEMFPMHKQDLETCAKKITLRHIMNNIHNQINHQKRDLLIERKEIVMTSVTGFVRNLVKVDYDNSVDLLLEIAITDYTVSKNVVDKIEDSMLKDHIDLYENYSRNEILNELSDNPVFLLDAIWTIADIYVCGEFRGISISKEELDLNKSKSIIKKLNQNK